MSPSRLVNTRVRTQSTFAICILFLTLALVWTVRPHAGSTIGEPVKGSPRAMVDDIRGVTPAATTFVVNNVGDQDDSNIGDGHCDIDGNLGNGDQCTLRAAVSEGKVGNTGHSINFNLPSGSVIVLSTQLPAFSGNVTIVGPGSNQLTIQRNTAGGTPSFSIFSFAPINGNFTDSVSGLTIANGSSGCLGNQSFDTVTLTDLVVRNCTNGPAIQNGGNMTLTNSTVTGNTNVNDGGGILNNGGGNNTLSLTDSTVSGNSTNGNGGGIFNSGGTVNLSRTTVTGNTSDKQGGGIANSSTLTVTNSTVSGNSANNAVNGNGGGVANLSIGGTITLTNVTVTANSSGATGGGGVSNVGSAFSIGNSIVAKNTGGFADLKGTFVSQGYNLIGLSGGDGLNNGVNGDQVGAPGAVIDPLLGPLANNGGLTKTHELLVGSPAIDAGNTSLTTDQRNQTRPTDDPSIANPAGGNGSDIGAYEVKALQVNTTSDADDGACTQLGTGNGCTLREAIAAANSNPPSDIRFAPALTAGGPATIDLLTALPAINANVRIDGPGANLLTIHRSSAAGTPNFRIFTVNAGQSLMINGLTAANGNVVGSGASNIGGNIFCDQGATLVINNSVVKDASNGGGISNFSGSITISNSTISGNGGVPGTSGSAAINNTVPTNNAATAPATVVINNSMISGNNGSAINNTAVVGNPASPATVVVNNSTISGNTSNAGGGAAVTNFVGTGGIATVTLTNCTISGNTNNVGNSAASGAISNGTALSGSNPTNATVTVTNSTIFGNAAASGGVGGIVPSSFSSVSTFKVAVMLRNTIVAGNTAGGASSDIANGTVDPGSSFNLIGTGGSGGLVNGTNGNQVGVASPGLGPLANNGGPTQTHPLLSTSPALDAGDNCVTQASHCGDANISQLTTDQRGFNRIVDGPDADTTATVDIGAYETQTALTNLPDTSTNEDTQLVVSFDAGDASTITSVTASSSNTAVVPNDSAHLLAANNGSQGSVTINPAANASGLTNITITINRTVGGPDVKTFALTVNPVNDAPTFTKGPDQTINEDAGPQTISNWATNISPGPTNESGQTLSFFVTNNNTNLFFTPPSVDASGTLTYRANADANGTATVTILVQDNGGTANGGVDVTSVSFVITVISVNDAPVFVKGPDKTVFEDAFISSTSWAANIGTGAGNETSQTLTFVVTNNTNPALFSAGPAVNPQGFLSYTLAANANGSATITLVLQDNGGTANGGVDTSAPQSFKITVIPVNDAPTFTKGPNQTVNEDAGAQTVNNWATNISKGPPDESSQNLTFQVTNNTNTALFAVAPAVTSTGTLTFTPAADVSGAATITLNLKDSGGTANGGSDTSGSTTFTITVNSVNDAPTFTKGADQTVNQNAGAQTVAGWASAISPGPANESAQTLTFTATNDNNALFSVQPAISSSGTLTYTPASNANGVANVSVTLKDSGGTANGGVDTSASQTFTITVVPPGGFINFQSSTANTTENSGSTTVTVVRTGNTSLAATVNYATNADTGVPCSTANGVASPKCDFTAALGTLNFSAGESSKTITILISQDSFVEGPETITVTLSSPTNGAALGTTSSMILTIADDATEPGTNVIDDANMFVRMHYHDFLNREGDQSGIDFWTGQMTNCGSPDLTVCRVNVSGAFFLSIEFQQTGYLVERIYKTGYGDATGTSTIGGSHQIFVPVVRFNEFLADTQRIGRGVVVGATGWEQALENNKQAYALEFVQTSRFINAFPTTMTPAGFVDKLNQNAGGVLSVSERQAVIDLFGNAVDTTNVAARAQALRQVAEDQDLFNAESNRAFVLSEYFGYLRRNPNDAPEPTLDYSGYDFWLQKLVQFNGNYINAEMVKAFISADEYRKRFGSQ